MCVSLFEVDNGIGYNLIAWLCLEEFSRTTFGGSLSGFIVEEGKIVNVKLYHNRVYIDNDVKKEKDRKYFDLKKKPSFDILSRVVPFYGRLNASCAMIYGDC